MSYFTTFGDDEVPTTFATPYGEEPTLYCPNNLCPAIELVRVGDEIEEIVRIAWGSVYVRASRIDQGYHSHDACPECGVSGRSLDDLL